MGQRHDEAHQIADAVPDRNPGPLHPVDLGRLSRKNPDSHPGLGPAAGPQRCRHVPVVSGAALVAAPADDPVVHRRRQVRMLLERLIDERDIRVDQQPVRRRLRCLAAERPPDRAVMDAQLAGDRSRRPEPSAPCSSPIPAFTSAMIAILPARPAQLGAARSVLGGSIRRSGRRRCRTSSRATVPNHKNGRFPAFRRNGPLRGAHIPPTPDRRIPPSGGRAIFAGAFRCRRVRFRSSNIAGWTPGTSAARRRRCTSLSGGHGRSRRGGSPPRSVCTRACGRRPRTARPAPSRLDARASPPFGVRYGHRPQTARRSGQNRSRAAGPTSGGVGIARREVATTAPLSFSFQALPRTLVFSGS